MTFNLIGIMWGLGTIGFWFCEVGNSEYYSSALFSIYWVDNGIQIDLFWLSIFTEEG